VVCSRERRGGACGVFSEIRSHTEAPVHAWATNELGRPLDQPASQIDFHDVAVKIQRTPVREGPHQGRSTFVCSIIGRPARTPSIAIRTKEEQQIRVRT
jgi:hypothetical protein